MIYYTLLAVFLSREHQLCNKKNHSRYQKNSKMKYTTIHSHIGRTASEFQNCDGDDDDEQPSRQNHP